MQIWGANAGTQGHEQIDVASLLLGFGTVIDWWVPVSLVCF
jgi:hypothetical protein